MSQLCLVRFRNFVWKKFLIEDLTFTLDASLTSDSDTVEATKKESKDTEPVKKVHTCSVIMRFPQQQ